MAILEEQKVKFFQFLDNILKEKSTALVDGGDLKTKDLKKEGGEDNMAEEKRLEDMEKKLQELSDTFAKDKKAMEEAHKASVADGKFATIKLDDKSDMSISEVLVDILETIPTEVRVNLEEIAHNKKNEDPNKKYMSDKEVEE